MVYPSQQAYTGQPGLAPFTGVRPYQPRTGMEGLPTTGMPLIDLGIQVAGQSYLQPMMQQLGLSPFGISDQNVYDRQRQMEFTRHHDAVVQASSGSFKTDVVRMGRGISNLLGVEFGRDHSFHCLQACLKRKVGGNVSIQSRAGWVCLQSPPWR